MRESELYRPIKALLEGQGFEVKAEVGPADVVAVRGEEPPVIVELKAKFSLTLVHQAIERQAITDSVYVAVPATDGRDARKSLQRNLKLCRRLGLGLITVRLRDEWVCIHADPAPYQPRKSSRRRASLMREFARRDGDPNVGGSDRRGLVTAYRQDATRCRDYLVENGATKAALVAESTGVPNARRIMADNHYGWFQRVATGIYDLSPDASPKANPNANRDAGGSRAES